MGLTKWDCEIRERPWVIFEAPPDSPEWFHVYIGIPKNSTERFYVSAQRYAGVWEEQLHDLQEVAEFLWRIRSWFDYDQEQDEETVQC